jgi:hypothetical protein
LDAECLATIGCSLRAYYSGFVSQPIPEHLAGILEKIESRAAAGPPVVPIQHARPHDTERAHVS